MLLLPPIFFALTAARLAVSAPPQLAMSEPGSVELHNPFTAKPGDILLRAKVYDVDRVKIDKPFHASLAKFEQQIDEGTELSTVIVPEKARALTGVESNVYYCGEDLRTRSKFADAMIGDWFSKWESIVRFCFADVDSDNKLDHMVLAGAKDKAFQTAVAIDPIAYTRTEIAPDHDASEIRIVFKQLEPKTGELHLELQLWRNGSRQLFDYLLYGQRSGSKFLSPINLYPRYKSDPKKLPYPVHFTDIMGSTIGITSVNVEKAEAEFTISRPIGPALFKPVSIQYQYIFIYI
jgi:hypothetical protein